MKFTSKDAGKPAKCDLLALLVPEGEAADAPKGGRARRVPARLRRRVPATCHLRIGGPAREVVLIGLGEVGDIDAERIRRRPPWRQGGLARKAQSLQVSVAGVAVEAAVAERSPAGRNEGALMATYAYTESKSAPEPGSLRSVVVSDEGRLQARREAGRDSRRGEHVHPGSPERRGQRRDPDDPAKAARSIARKSPRSPPRSSTRRR